jgi:threonine dehydrogenase-like Zn-dependent dehydrogenase
MVEALTQGVAKLFGGGSTKEVDQNLLATTPQSHVKWDNSKKMLAAQWSGTKTVKTADHAVPLISHPRDAIVRMTTVTICGSDLHLYLNALPVSGAMKSGDIMGHEGVGIVEAVGDEVKDFKAGDRVVVSAVISCGDCQYCKSQQPSLCDRTNPSKQCEDLYGQRLAGIFGYSHLIGGYSGMQAEYLRVPCADNTLLKLPQSVSDEKAMFLSDVMCTGWHANELGEVTEGKTVAIWGAGPVGQMAAYLAKYRGASRVILIDKWEFRLNHAQKHIKCEVINFDKVGDVIAELKRILPGGPDVCIDASGFRFPKSIQQKMHHATSNADQADTAQEVYISCKKGGNVSLIGDYFGYANAFPYGHLMEKGITTRGSQVYVQKYWHQLLSKLEKGELDPTWEITHRTDFEKISEMYEEFCDHPERQVKLALKTKFGRDVAQGTAHTQSQQPEQSTYRLPQGFSQSARF